MKPTSTGSPNSSVMPAKMGEDAVGTVVATLIKAGNDPVPRYLVDVRMTFEKKTGSLLKASTRSWIRIAGGLI